MCLLLEQPLSLCLGIKQLIPKGLQELPVCPILQSPLPVTKLWQDSNVLHIVFTRSTLRVVQETCRSCPIFPLAPAMSTRLTTCNTMSLWSVVRLTSVACLGLKTRVPSGGTTNIVPTVLLLVSFPKLLLAPGQLPNIRLLSWCNALVRQAELLVLLTWLCTRLVTLCKSLSEQLAWQTLDPTGVQLSDGPVLTNRRNSR